MRSLLLNGKADICSVQAHETPFFKSVAAEDWDTFAVLLPKASPADVLLQDKNGYD